MSTKPQPNTGDYPWEPDRVAPMSAMEQFSRFLADFFIRNPTHWVRENIVEANRGPRYYWYHKKFEKALPVDECYLDDQACLKEADIEFKRGFMVDRATLELLRFRQNECNFWYKTTDGKNGPKAECDHLTATLKEAELNFHIKYGDTRHDSGVYEAFTKQKHRMIMERRIALRKQAAEIEYQEQMQHESQSQHQQEQSQE